MKRLRPLIIAAALAALTVPATAAANDFAGVVATDVYATTSASYQAKQFSAMQAAGVGVIRQTLDWASVEISPGVYDFTPFDGFVIAAAKHNIRVLPVLFDPPSFQRPAGASKKYTPFPKSNAAFAAFASQVVARYGVGGYFWGIHSDVPKLEITSYQIWNEPNLKAYSGGKPNAAQYVAMLQAVSPAIKAVDPAADVVTAGLPDSRLSQPNVFKYVQQMYAAGAKGTFDTLGVNPYAPTATSLISKLKKFRRIMDGNGDTASSIWVTELGWSDVGPKSPFRAGKSGQSRRIKQAISALKANEAALKLRGFFYFAWRDGAVYKGGKDFWGLHTGLLNKKGKTKPAYSAFKKAVAAL
jgi:polysaccharide biosynthesis protein PslG